MPKTAADNKALRPYRFHGMNVESREGQEEAYCDCPFCGREGKLSINLEKGLWRCLICAQGSDKGGGNLLTFLRLLWEQSDKASNGNLDALAQNRGLTSETLIYWGVCQSIITGDWLVPGWTADGKLCQLYKYYNDKVAGKMVLRPTPDLGLGIFGADKYDRKKDHVYVAEGPWDAMALWEVMRQTKEVDGSLKPTASETGSLLAGANVVGVPGCGSIGEPFKRWLPLFGEKLVALMFDNDHPKELKGKRIDPAGHLAMKRAVGIMATAERRPSEVYYLKWGENDHDPDLPGGYDVRDYLGACGDDLAARITALGGLLDKVQPIPQEWLGGKTLGGTSGGAPKGGHSLDIDMRECHDWPTLTNAWRKALRWTANLDQALSVMIASVFSTPTVGEQIWVMVLGTPSSAKTTLCEALGVNRTYVYPTDTLTSLTSGYQADKEGSENMSLVNRLHNKTLVINDGDTLLRLPNREQVLSQLRAFYGRNIRVQYGNKMSANNEGINTTIILCGTGSLMELDSAELGSRFITCDLGVIDDDLEDEIGWTVANRADRETVCISDGKLETRDEPDLVEAKLLTGGYINYLRADPIALLSQVESSEEALRECQRLAKFVAFMRARPSKKQDEKVERELSFRLISQYVRLAKCLAVVLNRKTLDGEVMARVKKVAVDTARGRSMDLARSLAKEPVKGRGVMSLGILLGEGEDKVRTLLRFLKRIGAADTLETTGIGRTPMWRLSAKMQKLFDEVLGAQAG